LVRFLFRGKTTSSGSWRQADDRQFSVGLLLILREAGCSGGDLPPCFFARWAMELFGGHGNLGPANSI